jgi:hypothetical protein
MTQEKIDSIRERMCNTRCIAPVLTEKLSKAYCEDCPLNELEVELITCRDCKHHDDIGIDKMFCPMIDIFPSDDFFCAFGERREEADDE